MKPGVIECALIGGCGRAPERRTSQNSGRDYATVSLAVGEGEAVQWLDVVAFGPAVDAMMLLAKGDACYIEGKLSLKSWTSSQDGTTRQQLSVVASLVQPMGRIGERKPKATRKTSAAQARGANANSAAVHQPLPFDDELPI